MLFSDLAAIRTEDPIRMERVLPANDSNSDNGRVQCFLLLSLCVLAGLGRFNSSCFISLLYRFTDDSSFPPFNMILF